MTFVLDCSHYQDTINWQSVKNSGCVGAYVKVSDGYAGADAMARANHDGARAVGIPVGPYHFSEDGNAVSEAANFAQYWAWGWDLHPVLDEEKSTASAAFITAFRTAFRQRTGFTPFRVYTSYALLNGALKPSGWLDGSTTTWAARYNSTLGWNDDSLVLWQNTSAASVPGIVGTVDEDQFMNGWTPAADMGVDDMELTDGLPVKRPDGSVPTVGEALGNMYIGEFYGGTSAGTGLYNELATIQAQLASIQGSLSANQAAVLAAVSNVSSGSPTAAQMATLTTALENALPSYTVSIAPKPSGTN